MEVDLREMDCYVAPTFINLENPTFWVNQGNIGVPRFTAPNKNSSFGGTSRGYYYQQNFGSASENLLRKILFVNDISFNFEFLTDDFVDNNNPSLTLDIKVERVEGSVSGQDWTRFLQVLE